MALYCPLRLVKREAEKALLEIKEIEELNFPLVERKIRPGKAENPLQKNSTRE